MYITAGWIFGILVVVLYLLTILNFAVKRINKVHGQRMKAANERRYRRFTAFMKFIVRYHRLFGVGAVALLVVHVIFQIRDYGYVSPTGAAAAAVMLLQAGLGMYGSRFRPKGKTWLSAHRAGAVLLPVLMAVHIFL